MTTLPERLLTSASFANLSSLSSCSDSISKRSERGLRSAAAGACALLLLLSASLLGYAQDSSSAVVHTTTQVKQIRTKRLARSLPYADRLSVPLKRRARTAQSHKPSNSGVISYTCDPSVAAGTCTYLNTTVAGDYSSSFSNANASIYITYGTTGLAESSQFFNFVTYSQYLAALTSNSNQSTIQTAAISALNTYDGTPYGSDNVEITAALGTALGFTGLTGITSGQFPCAAGTPGCYDAIITVTNDPSTPLYYDNIGGPEPPDAYDFYGVVEHETDEVLGTSSCIDTTTGELTDPCDSEEGTGTPSAVDLFRYNSAGALAANASYLDQVTAPLGAYFSYNGGATNGANGIAQTPKVYNTLANGDDYADFVSSSPDCGTDIAIQDAEGCPGEDAGLTILNDGGGEINILNAVGYDVPAQLCSPGTYSNTGSAPCTPAPAGTYVSGSGAESPTDCPLGTYQPSTGQTSCIAAPAGTYVSTLGATEPTLCAVGNYQPNTAQTSCIAAPAGSYVSSPGSAVATQCSPGNYQPNTGATFCYPAPAGQIVPGSGGTQAFPCSAGAYQPYSGQSSCFPAPAGSFVPGPGAIQPTLCPLGRYQPNTGSVSCFQTPPGSYSSSTGAVEPTLCSPGNYQPNSGQTTCIPAPAGTSVSSSGAIEPTNCSAGSYQPNTGQVSCLAAPAGSYVSTSGAIEPTLCTVGRYQPNTGQVSCLLTPPGSYSSNAGAIEPTLCAAGAYQPSSGQTSCIPAPAGSYVNAVGAAAATPCAAGSYQPSTGSTSCILAGIGYFVASPGQANETQCPAGETTLAPGATSCIPDTVTVSPGSVNFGDAWVGLGAHHDVTVTNNGSVNVVVGPITFVNVTGNPGDFSAHNYCTIPLKPGKSCLINAKFMPSSAETETATMNIQITAPGSPLQVSLTGTGKMRH